MNTMQEGNMSVLWQPKVVSLIVPTLITCLVPILIFSSLSILQLIGSGILLSITILSLIVGDGKNLPNRDISILWVGAILYNVYLLSTVL